VFKEEKVAACPQHKYCTSFVTNRKKGQKIKELNIMNSSIFRKLKVNLLSQSGITNILNVTRNMHDISFSKTHHFQFFLIANITSNQHLTRYFNL
jgi:hypothetical protein